MASATTTPSALSDRLIALSAPAATDPLASVDPVKVGPYPVGCSNVAQNFTTAPTDVHSVRTALYPGKERRRGKFAGYRPDWKKAFVRLKSGEKMPEYAQNL